MRLKKILWYVVALACFLLQTQFVRAATADIPLRLNAQGVATVQALINGKRVRCLLDTGSPEGLHLPKAMLSTIPGLRLTGEPVKSMDLEGKWRQEQPFVISSINFNGLTLLDVSGVDLQDWGLALSFGTEAEEPPQETEELPVIGLGLFRDHVVTIDYARGLLSISDTALHDNEGWFFFPCRSMVEGVALGMTDGTKIYQLILDTGASVSIIKTEAVAKAFLGPSQAGKKMPQKQGELYQQISLRLEGIDRAPSVQAVVLDGLPKEFLADGLLGADFLSLFAVRLDLRANTMQLKQLEPSKRVSTAEEPRL